MDVTLDQDRLNRVTALQAGSHDPNEDAKWCAMEAVAWIAREPWSDHPECACPVLGAFVRAWNDGLNDEDRNRLILPLVPRLVGTKSDKATEERRALMAADWLVRIHTPAWLELAGLNDQAKALSSLPEITSMAQVPSIKGPIDAARKDADAAWAAARAAAGDAAGDAARAAARDAARATARDAARDAAGDAAGAAAGDAAWAAAWATARAAAWAAARAKLRPTQDRLIQSAAELVERMISA